MRPRRRAADVAPAVFSTDAVTYLEDASLSEEVFGPSTLFVESSDRTELLRIANELEGHLTASIFGTDEELAANADLIAILQRKVGRLIFNQFPTGVEVCPSMVHGGPYPATTDGRSTSVGTAAIFRFTRPISYQGFPQDALPEELKDANPLGIMRTVDGGLTRDPGRLCLEPAADRNGNQRCRIEVGLREVVAVGIGEYD